MIEMEMLLGCSSLCEKSLFFKDIQYLKRSALGFICD